ncbi:hypothetical protein [Marinomonas sp.]|uniref:hypothetical protein n=1 Tax=Marinomonas sp. TaxID=1904862 RepID=UPI003BA96F8F
MINLYSAKSTYPSLKDNADKFIKKFTATAAITGEVKKLDGDTQFEAFGKFFELKFSMVRNPIEKLHLDFLGEIRAYTITETATGAKVENHLACIWFDRQENSTDLLKEDTRLHSALTEDDTVSNFTQVLLYSLLDSDHFKAYGVQDKK